MPLLAVRCVSIRQGTTVESTLIAAPSFTKMKDWKRDPKMHQNKKGNQSFFGMEIHAGVHRDSGFINTVVVTSADVRDLTPAAEL